MQVIGEVGLVNNFNHNAQIIELAHSYQNPVIFAQPLSYAGSDPAIVRIENIQSDRFSAYLQEPNYKDGSHTNESFSYLVLEAGSWQLENGALLEVGTFNTNLITSNGNWAGIDFSHDFATDPILFSQVQTNNDTDFVRTRHRAATADGFQLALEEEEALNQTGHGSETVGWFAMTPGQGTWNGFSYLAGNTPDSVTDRFYTINFGSRFSTAPNLLASIATFDNSDPSGLRYRNLTSNQVQLKIEEDQSADSETRHTTEVVGFLALGGNGLLTGLPTTIGSAGVLSFSRSDFSMTEDGTPVTQVTIDRVDGSSGSISATLTLGDGTAITPTDYDSAPILVEFADGETTKTVTVPILEDTLSEADETINLSLSAPTGGAALGSLVTAVLTIADNDPVIPISEGIVFPEDAGVINVLSYGAIPNDGRDDTAAIQQALNNHPTGNHVFYFPDGVYDISNTLTLAGSQKRNIFQGQSEAGTILRLMDSVSPNFSGALINFGPSPAQRFRNSLRDMTLSVGVNHPDAIAVQFNASNQGVMRNVTLLSEDGQGNIGLDMSYTDEVGPLLVSGVTIDGFDYGIMTRWPTASQTFEDITLRNQNIYGWRNTSSQRVFARNVQSTNSVTAIRNDGEAGFVLIDSTLTGTGTASEVAAIVNQKSIFIRNTMTSGYALGVDSIISWGRGNPDVPVGYIDQYLGNGAGQNRSGVAFELFPSPDRMIGLPVQETPIVPWEQNLNNWSGPHLHRIGNSGIPNDGIDDTPSIQAAIASGATTIYLPRGTWNLDGTIELGGTVQRFMGTEATIEAGSNALIRVGAGSTPLVIERLETTGNFTVEHLSDRTLIFNNLLGVRYLPSAPAPGDVFLNDVLLLPSMFRNQNVWARQLNMEGDTESDPTVEAKLLNNNARVWLLGVKTEDEGTVIKTINGGVTELYGALHVGSGTSNAANPRFVTIDSAFAAAGVYGGGFSVLASETRNGETRTTNTFNLADAYTAYPADFPFSF